MTGNLRSVYLKLVLTTFFWGGTFVAARLAVKEAPPFFAATCRFTVAATCLIALTAWYASKEGKSFPVPAGGRQLALLFSLGVTGIFCYNAVFFTGLKLTTATSGALIVAINPLLTAVLSALWLRERVNLTQGVGLLVSLLGVSVVISKGSWAVLAGFAFNKGDLIMLGAPLCWALYSILGKKALASFTPLAATAYAALFGTMLLFPAALLEHAVLGGPWPSFSWIGWLAILQLALLGTVVGFVWWYQGVGQIGAARAAVFVNLVPFFGALQAALLLGERVVLPQFLGGVLVVAGVYCGSRGNAKGQAVREPEGRGAQREAVPDHVETRI
ncbi:DMT family transporter [Geomonas propionica]|uniref:DMT family transporter n=1 Tax=Geomonas propionica TaxID=2798582 RepID=A0ABS0YLL3_9BACT|nr:DMT family transporter [Geomonas propionica]MBJ6798858.1 DMT family transporter [Geomonas propionica]